MTLHPIVGFDPEVIVFRGVVTASLVSLALVGCTAQSLSPLQRADTANQTQRTIQADSGIVGQSPTAVFQWTPTSIKMTDAGPYVPTSLMFTHGDTVVVNYDQQCDYRVEFDLHTGPTKHHVETDQYDFYAYSGKSPAPPYHCKVNALLKNSNGQVIAYADLAVTITYPKKHAHGG
jgi:hypothetical protein